MVQPQPLVQGAVVVAGKTTYVYDKVQKKFVEKSKRVDTSIHAIHTLEEFVSPIDQSIIRTPADLARHNRRHGVTDSRDYSPEYLAKATNERMAGFNERGKQDRINDLNRAYEHHRK